MCTGCQTVSHRTLCGMVLLFKCVYNKLVQGARIEFDYMRSVLIEIERYDCMKNLTEVNLYLL